ncbi:MAG: GAF domain-containing sensor histidine kinase [Spirulinaceae cyanobacterium]
MMLQNSLLNFPEKQQNSSLIHFQQQLQYQEVINLLLHKMSETPVVEDILQTAVNLLQEALGVSRCLIFRPLSPENPAEVSYVLEATEEEESLIGFTSAFYSYYYPSLKQGEGIILNRIEPHLAAPVQEAASKLNFHSALVIPIIYQQQYLGGIAFHDCQQEYQWTEAEINLGTIVASQIAITLNQAQQQIRLRELEAENQTKTAFLDHTSHELRTPLTGILGFSRVLIDQLYGPLNDKQLQYLQGIFSCGEHLLSLINDLLDLSKVDADREELYWENIPVEELCLATLSLVQEKAKEEGLELLLEIEPGITTCKADQRRLKQILVNLLSNAVKFTESGSITLKVARNEQGMIFSVIDTGIGISETNQKKLFQPFTQIESHLNRKHKGTGLGLALSRKLARLHGGDITLSSQPGQGSCFAVSLPLQQDK